MNRHQQQALDDFNSTYHRARLVDRLTRLHYRSTRLRSLQDDRRGLAVRGEHYRGLSSVPIERIVGSTDRCRDFDTIFRPLRASSASRWMSVARAHSEGRVLPPVQLYQLGDAYYVRDGHHRVSVARMRGQAWIDAEVVEVLVRVPQPASQLPSSPKPPLRWVSFHLGWRRVAAGVQ